MNPSSTPRATVSSALLVALLLTPIACLSAKAETKAEEETRPFRIEVGSLFGYSTRQIEAAGLDVTVSNDAEWVVDAAGLYGNWYGFSPGLFFNYDRTIGRSGPSGSEVNLGVLVRYTFLENFWAQVGYMFLMRRWDDARVGLFNTAGQNFGTFEGSASKAFMFGFGAQYPLTERLYLTGKAEVRIRYFDERNGQPLAGGAEYGGLSFSPYLGLAYAF